MAGLYIHIPYCHAKCAYCDFFSTPRREDMDSYVTALVEELKLRRGELHEPIFTIYIGGGTPSILPAEIMQRLIGGIRSNIDCSMVEEFTVEVNPEDLSKDLIFKYKSLGINRISMGVQSFNNNLLCEINRRHSGATAIDAINILKESGLNYSLDLIYGLPGQTLDDWKEDLDRLLSFKPPHFSAYLLSYEQGTRLYARLLAGKVEEASEHLVNDMYSNLCIVAADHGYQHYEISNFSLPKFHSRHNSSYWEDIPYLGLGVSAHSFDGRIRRANPADIKGYIAAINRGELFAEIEYEDSLNRYNDIIITGLRTAKGINLNKLMDKSRDLTLEMLRDVQGLIDKGILIRQENRLIIPERHWLTADATMRELIRI